MTNDASSKLGMRPVTQPYGNMRIGYYKADTAQALYRYQPVALSATGTVKVAGLADNTPVLGVIVGFLDSNKEALPDSMQDLTAGAYLPALKAGYVAVTDDPNQLYLLEEDTGGSALTLDAIGNTAVWTYLATTGNTTTGVANVVLDRSTIAADTGGSLQLVALGGETNSDGTHNAVGNNGKWVCRISNHQFGNQALSVPV